MIKIGFLINVSNAWLGGVNYYRNLLYALNKVIENDIEVYLFLPKDTDQKLKDEFALYAKVIEIDFLSKYNLKRIVWKISEKITKSDFVMEFYLRNYKIDVYSHSGLVGLYKAKTINWIPDFQHKHLPNYFQDKDNRLRDKAFKKIVKKSDIVILSSYDALKDFNIFFKNFSSKTRVLQFVSQPGKFNNNYISDFDILKNKYKIDDDFFIIPNHFWKHKNHLVVFKSMLILKERGINTNLICTGLLEDYRDPNYVESVKLFIQNNSINAKLLGVIEYKDLLVLMKKSISVINPSLFEGWSTTVEECKSLGKNIILSDINIHKEQNPENSVYFNPYDPEILADILQFHIENRDKVMNLYDFIKFKENLEVRTLSFGKKFQSIIKEVYSRKN